ncbi:MAG: imidazole glycerol phosphate synthase subunit HisH [Planctomycetota bacterium]|nr:imidazole glycerol phosphate synthase subunit HisH [Planctomycetota bacterium]
MAFGDEGAARGLGGLEVTIIATGVANVASVRSAFERLGVRTRLSAAPQDAARAPLVVLPGVGSFGAAMAALRGAGLAGPLAARIGEGRPTLAICLGLQLLAASSEESPGAEGLGVIAGRVTRFRGGARVPHMGWNVVRPAEGGTRVEAGEAYYANSFKLDDGPEGWAVSTSEYGERFVAAVERGDVLACQFHPELSGEWGLRLIGRWLATSARRAEGRVAAC